MIEGSVADFYGVRSPNKCATDVPSNFLHVCFDLLEKNRAELHPLPAMGIRMAKVRNASDECFNIQVDFSARTKYIVTVVCSFSTKVLVSRRRRDEEGNSVKDGSCPATVIPVLFKTESAFSAQRHCIDVSRSGKTRESGKSGDLPRPRVLYNLRGKIRE